MLLPSTIFPEFDNKRNLDGIYPDFLKPFILHCHGLRGTASFLIRLSLPSPISCFSGLGRSNSTHHMLYRSNSATSVRQAAQPIFTHPDLDFLPPIETEQPAQFFPVSKCQNAFQYQGSILFGIQVTKMVFLEKRRCTGRNLARNRLGRN